MSGATLVLGLLAETPLHPGAGRVTGAVDLPVARESTTDYPTIPGSGLKGALRDRARQAEWDEVTMKDVFGHPDGAGGIAVTDARLLLLPVRSLTGHYRWVTCPYVLERLQRDLALAGVPASLPLADLKPDKGQVLGPTAGKVFLEELSFDVALAAGVAEMARAVAPLVKHESVRDRLAAQVLVLHDDDFAYFARFGLAVSARNRLNDKSKTSENLWYEETLPSDTILYTVVMARPGQDDPVRRLRGLLDGSRPYLQVGGNETVGQGWCALAVVAGEAVQA